MKKFLFVAALAAVSVFTFSGCSKDDDKGPGTHKVQYKVIGSANVKLNTIVYSNESNDQTAVSGLTGNTWTSSELNINGSVVPVIAISSSGYITDNVNGTIEVQIIVDGSVKKTNKGEGDAVVAQTSYTF